jgi:hypothetical protein
LAEAAGRSRAGGNAVMDETPMNNLLLSMLYWQVWRREGDSTGKLG